MRATYADILLAKATRAAKEEGGGSSDYECAYLRQTVRTLCDEIVRLSAPDHLKDELCRFRSGAYTVVCGADTDADSYPAGAMLLAVYAGAADVLGVLCDYERERLEALAHVEHARWLDEQMDIAADARRLV